MTIKYMTQLFAKGNFTGVCVCVKTPSSGFELAFPNSDLTAIFKEIQV